MATATPTAHRRMDLAELVDEHQANVWRYLRFLGCDESRADDLVQETFLTVWRKPFEQRGPAATAAYLRRVARNLFLMSLRQRRRERELESLEAAEAVWVQYFPDDRPSRFLEALGECLQSVNGRARQAIDLRYREGRSRAEIGDALEMTDDGVKTLLRRTRDVLRACVRRKIEEAG